MNTRYCSLKNKNENITIQVIYLKEDVVIGEATFNSKELTFGKILDFYETNIKTQKKYSNTKLKLTYNYNGMKIDTSDYIIDLIPYKEKKTNRISKIQIRLIVDEIKKLDDEYEDNFTKILIPKINEASFGLYLINPSTGIIDVTKYPDKIFKNSEYELYKTNSKTSYCNNYDYLFLSGGEYLGQAIDNFWIIDNKKFNITLMKMPFVKKDHSMIEIKNKSVFVVGGEDSVCFFYDIKRHKFILWEHTQYIHINPIVFLSDDFIYCFSDFKHIEKTNISRAKKWEKILPKFFEGDIKFNFSEYGVSKSYNKNIIIVGGIKNYIYNLKNNLLESFENDYKNLCIFKKNKNFYKVSKYFNIGIPSNFNENLDILVLNKKNKELSKPNFILEEDKTKLRFRYNENIDEDLNNNLSLKIEYEFSPINLFGEDVLKKINLNYDKNKKNKNIIQNYNNKIILNQK